MKNLKKEIKRHIDQVKNYNGCTITVLESIKFLFEIKHEENEKYLKAWAYALDLINEILKTGVVQGLTHKDADELEKNLNREKNLLGLLEYMSEFLKI